MSLHYGPYITPQIIVEDLRTVESVYLMPAPSHPPSHLPMDIVEGHSIKFTGEEKKELGGQEEINAAYTDSRAEMCAAYRRVELWRDGKRR